MRWVRTILGQPGAIGALQSALHSGRLHHAYIFHGSVGVGKFTTACRFAKVLLCHDPRPDRAGQVVACNVCQSCRLLGGIAHPVATAGDVAHPDFHVVAKELARYSQDAAVRGRKLTSIPVEVLRRSLIDPVYRGAQLGRRKVLILDQAHLLSETGQNLLLKTLEQPPAGTHLILVTDGQDKLLVTIRSRCQRVAFVPLSDEQVSRWLDEQAVELTTAQRQWLVGFATGSPGLAQVAIEYDLFDWAQTVIPALDQMCLGRFPIELGQQIAQMIDGFAKRWVDQHDGASKEAANRQAAGLMWTVIGQHARQMITAGAVHSDVSDPEITRSLLAPWLGVIDALEAAGHDLAVGVNIGIVTDHLVSRMDRWLARSTPVSGQPAALLSSLVPATKAD